MRRKKAAAIVVLSAKESTRFRLVPEYRAKIMRRVRAMGARLGGAVRIEFTPKAKRRARNFSEAGHAYMAERTMSESNRELSAAGAARQPTRRREHFAFAALARGKAAVHLQASSRSAEAQRAARKADNAARDLAMMAVENPRRARNMGRAAHVREAELAESLALKHTESAQRAAKVDPQRRREHLGMSALAWQVASEHLRSVGGRRMTQLASGAQHLARQRIAAATYVAPNPARRGKLQSVVVSKTLAGSKRDAARIARQFGARTVRAVDVTSNSYRFRQRSPKGARGFRTFQPRPGVSLVYRRNPTPAEKWIRKEPKIWLYFTRVPTRDVAGRVFDVQTAFRIDAREKPVRVDKNQALFGSWSWFEAIDGGARGVPSIKAGKALVARYIADARAKVAQNPKRRRKARTRSR